MRFKEFTKVIDKIEELNNDKQIKNLLTELKNYDLLKELEDLLNQNKSLNDCIEIYEKKNYDFIYILNPILRSGISIDEYKKVLIYLYSLESAKFKTKEEILNNKKFPKIDSLLIFLNNLESNKELSKINAHFLEKGKKLIYIFITYIAWI